MVKGINRQVIEINDTGSVYYEKILLMVKPAYADLQQSLLEKEAKSILKDLDAPSAMKAKRSFGFWFWRLGASAVLGAMLCILTQLVF